MVHCIKLAAIGYTLKARNTRALKRSCNKQVICADNNYKRKIAFRKNATHTIPTQHML